MNQHKEQILHFFDRIHILKPNDNTYPSTSHSLIILQQKLSIGKMGRRNLTVLPSEQKFFSRRTAAGGGEIPPFSLCPLLLLFSFLFSYIFRRHHCLCISHSRFLLRSALLFLSSFPEAFSFLFLASPFFFQTSKRPPL